MSDFSPGDFLKCPNCHRTTTVKLVMHIDGDDHIECEACEAHASAFKLHQQDRVYQ